MAGTYPPQQLLLQKLSGTVIYAEMNKVTALMAEGLREIKLQNYRKQTTMWLSVILLAISISSIKCQQVQMANIEKMNFDFFGIERDQRDEQIAQGCQTIGGQPCDYSRGGFHVICTGVQYNEANNACAQFGWREAEANDTNAYFLADVLRTCLSQTNAGGGWIRSFNGLTG
jgi:hypothetical protein